MKVSEIRDILKAEVLVGEDQLNKTIVAGGGADLMGDVLAAVAKEAVLLTGVNSEEALRTAKIVGVGAIAASGAAFSTGPRSAGGKLDDYLSPLECRVCAEVSHAASGLSLEKMNEIAKALLPKFEDSIKDPYIGKIVHDVYDLEKFEPKPEWQKIYDDIKEEVAGLGITL